MVSSRPSRRRPRLYAHGPYNLTIYGNAFLATNATWMQHPTGYVARFQSAGDYAEGKIPPLVVIPSNGPPWQPLTIEARIYPRSYLTDSGSDAQYIVSLYQAYDSEWVLYYDPYQPLQAPGLYAAYYKPPIISNTNWNQFVSLNTWHLLKMTFDRTGTNIAYIDGVPRGTNGFTPYPYYGTNWTLTFGHFDGDIDEVRISNIVRQ